MITRFLNNLAFGHESSNQLNCTYIYSTSLFTLLSLLLLYTYKNTVFSTIKYLHYLNKVCLFSIYRFLNYFPNIPYSWLCMFPSRLAPIEHESSAPVSAPPSSAAPFSSRPACIDESPPRSICKTDRECRVAPPSSLSPQTRPWTECVYLHLVY